MKIQIKHNKIIDRKKEEELFFLDIFKKHYHNFPSGNLIPSEQPDFLIESKNYFIGIEWTRFHHQPEPGNYSQKQKEKLYEKINNQIKRKYEKKNNEKVMVTIHYYENIRVKDNEIEDIAIQISNLIKLNMPLDYQSIRIDYDHKESLPKEIYSINITKIPDKYKNHFGTPSAVVIPDLSIHHVQQTIDSKNLLFPKYNKRCTEIWLVIFIHTFDLSSIAEVTNEVKDKIYHSLFKKNFIYEYPDKIHLLHTNNDIQRKS